MLWRGVSCVNKRNSQSSSLAFGLKLGEGAQECLGAQLAGSEAVAAEAIAVA